MKFLSAIALGFSLILQVALHSEAVAGFSCPAGALSCRFESMPFYDQGNPALGPEWLPFGGQSSMLCVPTAAAMALASAVIDRPENSHLRGFTADHFSALDEVGRVISLAKAMRTFPKSGTFDSHDDPFSQINYTDYTSGLAGNFVRDDGTVAAAGYSSLTDPQLRDGTVPIDGKFLMEKIKSGYRLVVGAGYYTYGISKSGIPFWIRRGGHQRAISGFEVSADGSEIIIEIHNPLLGAFQKAKVDSVGGEKYMLYSYAKDLALHMDIGKGGYLPGGSLNRLGVIRTFEAVQDDGVVGTVYEFIDDISGISFDDPHPVNAVPASWLGESRAFPSHPSALSELTAASFVHRNFTFEELAITPERKGRYAAWASRFSNSTVGLTLARFLALREAILMEGSNEKRYFVSELGALRAQPDATAREIRRGMPRVLELAVGSTAISDDLEFLRWIERLVTTSESVYNSY